MNAEQTPYTPERIAALRRELGLTQELFAHELGVTTATVNRWENGHGKVSRLAQRALDDLARRTSRRARR